MTREPYRWILSTWLALLLLAPRHRWALVAWISLLILFVVCTLATLWMGLEIERARHREWEQQWP